MRASLLSNIGIANWAALGLEGFRPDRESLTDRLTEQVAVDLGLVARIFGPLPDMGKHEPCDLNTDHDHMTCFAKYLGD